MTVEEIRNGIPDAIPFPDELAALVGWLNENSYPISGYFELCADDGNTMSYWFGFRDVESRLGQFGAGPDGSLYCIWDDGHGSYPIVHMGSEGQENKVLALDFVGFLRLLAIGYGEIGFEDMSLPPVEDKSNPRFTQWVTEVFKVSIPVCGAEIVEAAKIESHDFQSWINAVLEEFG